MFVDNFHQDKPVRIVAIGGGLGCPCGGTHVKDVREIGFDLFSFYLFLDQI
jgi:Ser-tRNA(Ala) deacylase AlaX